MRASVAHSAATRASVRVAVASVKETAVNSRIIGFYSDTEPDHRGRYVHEIQQWTDSRLEGKCQSKHTVDRLNQQPA